MPEILIPFLLLILPAVLLFVHAETDRIVIMLGKILVALRDLDGKGET